MNKILLICGHAKYATGIMSTLELIVGKNKDVYSVDFTEDDSDVTLREKIINIV